MRNIKTLTAKVLIVNIVNIEAPPHLSSEGFSYEVLEFQNGMIMVEGSSTHDWFFANRQEFEPCGCDIVESIKDSGETRELTTKELLEALQGSVSEFGSIPANHAELWR